MPDQRIESERLYLRPSNIEDAAFILEIMNSPKWLQYISKHTINTIDRVENYIQTKLLVQFEQNNYGSYTVIRKSDEQKVGICGLYVRKELEGVDLGFGLLEVYEKQGYAYEAARALSQYAFRILNFSKLGGLTHPDNKASQKLLEKLGFEFQCYIRVSGKDSCYYRLRRANNFE